MAMRFPCLKITATQNVNDRNMLMEIQKDYQKLGNVSGVKAIDDWLAIHPKPKESVRPGMGMPLTTTVPRGN